jgi:type I restriction enzyme S subunit
VVDTTERPPATETDLVPGYRVTELGLVPSEWKVARLGDVVATVRNGLTKPQGKMAIGVPVTRIETIAREEIDPLRVGYLQDLSPEEISKYALQPGDVLFSHINSESHLGKSALYEGAPSLLLHGMNLLLIRVNRGLVDPFFVHSLFKLYRAQGIFVGLGARAVGQASINQGKLRTLKIPLPPLPEQRAIAHVLRTVQRARKATDKVIAATRELKKSLMRHLFVYGSVPVDQVDEVRLKDTEIGPLPELWKVEKLGDIACVVMGQSPPGNSYNLQGAGIPLVNGPTEFGTKHPLLSKWTTNPTKTCEDGDILICVRGHTTGRLNIANGGYCIGRGVAAIHGRALRGYNGYLNALLEGMKTTILEFARAGGSTFPNITKTQLESLLVPAPPLEEQLRIAETLTALKAKTEFEENRKQALESLFNTSIAYLMTGKVRVYDLSVAASAEVE